MMERATKQGPLGIMLKPFNDSDITEAVNGFLHGVDNNPDGKSRLTQSLKVARGELKLALLLPLTRIPHQLTARAGVHR